MAGASKKLQRNSNKIAMPRLAALRCGKQLLVIAACSAVVVAASFIATGSAFKQQATTQQQKQPQSYKTVASTQQTQQLGDLDSAASQSAESLLAAAGYLPASSQELAGINQQPSIYHSIIDRTASGSQPASPVQASAAALGDLNTAAGHHHGHSHGHYYEYREVPKKKTWKFGYKRGNHKHWIERHEHGKSGKHHPHFKTKVKWADKKSKGKGIHLWDYNHGDKKHHHG